MWMRYISTPKVQAEQAVDYGETPDNKLACPYMNQIQKGSCEQYHANAPLSYFKSISLWKTPVATCDNGKPDCVPYSQWAAGVDDAGDPVAVASSGPGSGRPSRPRSPGPDLRVRWSRTSAALWRRPWARAALLLTPALAWFVLIYLAALVVLLITAFWRINAFTTNIERVWNLGNFTLIFGNSAYRDIVLRTIGMAAGVTVVDAIIALPVRLLHGENRSRQHPDRPVCRDPASALGQLPGQGVRLAADLHARRAAELDARQSGHRPGEPRSTPTGPCSSSSAMSGCPS